MRSALPVAIAFVLTAGVTAARADVTETWVSVDQVDVHNEPSVSTQEPHLAITGVLQGASSPTTRTYYSTSSYGAPKTRAQCEKMALLSLARPGRYTLQVVHGETPSGGPYHVIACRLSRAN